MLEKLPYETGFSLSCDTCSNYEEFEVGNNWKEFLKEAKSAGWRFKQNEYGQYEHYCPACVEKYAQKLNEGKI